jgi:hypothetical protein
VRAGAAGLAGRDLHGLDGVAIPGGEEELDGPVTGALLRAQLERRNTVGGLELRAEGARHVGKLVPASRVAPVHAGHDLAGAIGRGAKLGEISLEFAQASISDRRLDCSRDGYFRRF